MGWFTDNCMKANPEKFQAIAVGKKSATKIPSFEIDSQTITCETFVKLLGIDIDYELNFDLHVKSLCRKASRQLNVLKRIGHNLSKLNKITIFYSFVLSTFNFCPLAWHFCSKTNVKKLEKIQERALRFIYEDYNTSYEDLLETAKVPSLEIRRLRIMAIETFKILYNLSPSCLNDLVCFKNNKYSFRYVNILDIPRVRTTTYGKRSFRYAAAVLWNELPNHFRAVSSFSYFRSLMLSWNGKECSCSVCR